MYYLTIQPSNTTLHIHTRPALPSHAQQLYNITKLPPSIANT